jgi:hypothetical protein
VTPKKKYRDYGGQYGESDCSVFADDSQAQFFPGRRLFFVLLRAFCLHWYSFIVRDCIIANCRARRLFWFTYGGVELRIRLA